MNLSFRLFDLNPILQAHLIIELVKAQRNIGISTLIPLTGSMGSCIVMSFEKPLLNINFRQTEGN
jgi:hypothetical protein